MHPVLYDILAAKKAEVISNRRPLPVDRLKPLDVRDFRKAVNEPEGIGIIGEIKTASPSAGIIRRNVDPVRIAVSYERAGVSAVSVVTEKNFFHGSTDVISSVRAAVSIPVLRKDFIIDESQIYESRDLGADAVLLIARILSRRNLKRFLDLCSLLNITAITEVHSDEDLEKALFCGADTVGINNRNLATFDVDIATTSKLAPKLPAQCCVISESGIRTIEDLQQIADAGVSAALVGTALMQSADPGEAAERLAAAGRTLRKRGKPNVQG
jgi:indole-3-glycerol phosphate synthase